LELSQKDLKRERKVWQDKESATKRQISQLSAEVRELKAKLHQSSDIHDAYKQHVESKEAARSTETSGWDMRKQALLSEHQLELKKASGAQANRIAQLEAEVERLKAELEHSATQLSQYREDDSGYEKKSSKPTTSSSSILSSLPKAEIDISITATETQPTETSTDEASF